MESEISEPSRQGWMRTTMSKMSKINKWADRYFVLHGPVLYYYLKNTDTVHVKSLFIDGDTNKMKLTLQSDILLGAKGDYQSSWCL